MSTNGLTNLKINQFQAHPYHLVDNSPWPFFISWSLFFMAIGAVLYMKGFVGGGFLLFLGFILTLSTMFFWLGDVHSEGSYGGHHTKEVKSGLMLGFILFIVSEVFAFLSVFWAYFHSSLVPDVQIGGNWPPEGIHTLDPFSLPLLNTFLLVSSGAFVTFGHHALIAGNRKKTINGIIITIILAILFTTFQAVEYYGSDYSISDGVFGTVFFASTGLHGFHVIVGTLFIIYSCIRIIYHTVTKQTHVGVEQGILYWHFVDVVWLFLFMVVYFWGSGK